MLQVFIKERFFNQVIVIILKNAETNSIIFIEFLDYLVISLLNLKVFVNEESKKRNTY